MDFPSKLKNKKVIFKRAVFQNVKSKECRQLQATQAGISYFTSDLYKIWVCAGKTPEEGWYIVL